MSNSEPVERQTKTAFKDLNAAVEETSNDRSGVTELDSVCMSCYKTGRTKLMLTRIPFYRDVIISSFTCENCNFKNNSIQSANKIQENGVRIKLIVKHLTDLNREVVKSDYALLRIPLIDFEITPLSQKGTLTTIEGILDNVITNLEADIELKKEIDKDLTDKLAAFVEKVKDLKALKLGEFEVILDDPSGDSFIENPKAPNKDPQLTVNQYVRNKEQNEMIGLEEETEEANDAEELANSEQNDEPADLKNEVCQFQANCPNCNALCETNMKLTDIPYFKTVIIMCTVCDACGIRSSEIKPGTGIEKKGVRFTLKLTDPSDLNRDLIKSDFASFEIPEIEFFMDSGTLGGKFTTIEGLLKDSREQLDQVCPFSAGGDSESKEKAGRMRTCLDSMEKIQNGKMLNVTVILDDPSGNSYLQNVYAPEDDPNLIVEHYERDYDQNELLGLNDINTENYQEND